MGEGKRGHPLGVPSPGSGRLSKTHYSEEAKQQLHEAVFSAVDYLRGVTTGAIKRANPNRVQAAMYILNQVIGKPTQRIEAEGSVSPVLEGLLRELAEIHKGDTNGPKG